MGMDAHLPCKLQHVTNLNEAATSKTWDAICIIDATDNDQVTAQISEIRKFDESVTSEVSCFRCPGFECRIIYSPMGELTDFDDVRAYADAAKKAVRRALKAGAKSPILCLPKASRFENADLVALLGALAELYVPIQYREAVPAKKQRFAQIGVHHSNAARLSEILNVAQIYEAGRHIARDIGGGDPERMAPPAVVEYVRAAFQSNKIKMTVVDNPAVFKKDYPLFEAVNRAASVVPRHQGAIIFLEYKPPQPARKTLMLVGKGVTYDTGGADIKAGGIMAGMSRDKCGAAAVAGFMKIVEETAPADIHVFGALCMVRNSVGEECFVSDEMITSRAGQRVRIGNTDAEGRLCMADSLCQMKEMVLAQNLPDPHLFTIATLTGHAVVSVGNYSIIMDNGPARQASHAQRLMEVGEAMGDPFEISTIRKEDFDFNAGKCYGEDILQCNNLPSSRTARGHQIPAAFMMMSTGLDKCGVDAKRPIKYTHLDIAGSGGDLPHPPTAAPIVALAKLHLS